MWAIVTRVDNDRVIRDPHLIECFEHDTDGVIMLHHTVDIFAVAMLIPSTMAVADMGAQMHTGRIEPAEKRLTRRLLTLHKIDGCGRCFVIDRLYALLRECTSVFDRLLAN